VWLDRETYFKESFQELKTPFDASDSVTAMMMDWFKDHSGLQTHYQPDLASELAVLRRLGEHGQASLNVTGAAFREGNIVLAEEHAHKAIAWGHPLPGLALNYLACAAAAREDYDTMMDSFSEAARTDPQHAVLIRNVNRARAWFKQGGPARGLPLELDASHEFRLLEKTVQPTLPGPLGDTSFVWGPDDALPPGVEPAHQALEGEPREAVMGSRAELKSRKHLKVV
jgi:hypothetical protein